MTVNPTKSKCILFTSKNKINKKDNFNIGEHYLENVSYLGVDINAAGSFKASMDILSAKANKIKYALNNIAKLKLLPIKTALRLFDAAILPILTYGSEIWALNSTLNDDKWNISSTERIHLNFVKHILGINRSVNNLLCRAELGRYPISIEINHKILNFYKHIRELPRDSIAYQAYVTDDTAQGTCKLRTLKQHVTNLKNVTGKDLLNLSKKSSKKELKNSYEILWKNKLKTCTRGIYYLNFKQNIFYEKYLDHVSMRKTRIVLSKLRLSDHKLVIDQGRKTKPKTPKSDRICPLCNNGVNKTIEDEVHFLFNCSLRKYTAHREKFLNEIYKMIAQVKNLGSRQKFLFIVSCEDPNVIRSLLFLSLN